jgi:hypothetical protein
MRQLTVHVAAIALMAAAAPGANLAAVQSVTTQTDDHAAVRRVVDDYLRLYRAETLQQWRALFLPGFVAAYTNDDGSVTTRTLDEFYERQRGGFERGAMSERLENVRVDRMGRLAHVSADFYFTSGGETRHGRLMLILVAENDRFKIASLAFTYHL